MLAEAETCRHTEHHVHFDCLVTADGSDSDIAGPQSSSLPVLMFEASCFFVAIRRDAVKRL